MADDQNRRKAIKNMIAGTAAIGAAGMLTSFTSDAGEHHTNTMALKGNINHSVSPWCYKPMTLDELCVVSKQIGIKGVDLCGPNEWPTLQKHGLYSPMCNGAE